MFYVGLLVDDFVSEKSRCLARRVSNQGFVFREFELKIGMEPFSDGAFDVLGLVLGTDEAKQKVVCVPNVPKPPIVGIVWVFGWKLLELLACFDGFHSPSLASSAPHRAFKCDVGWVRLALVSSGVCWNEHLFDVLVEPVQVDVGKNGAYHPALWGAAVGLVVFPVLQVARLEQFANQP